MTIPKDYRQRFVFDHIDARGCLVSLNETCETIQATHHYPPTLANLLNQFSLAATLLRDSIKIEGSLTIQLRTQGAIRLIMADCLSDRRVRAIAEYESEQLSANENLALDQLGNAAVLAITITPDEGERYQSIVPIEKPTLADCLQDYFERSEQLPSLFRFFASADSAFGIALHALPAQKVKDKLQTDESLQRLQALLNTLTHDEALSLNAEELLTRLFHDESCRIYESHPVEFGCVCSAEKSLQAIKSLGQADSAQLVAEQKEQGNDRLVVDCHFCFQRYEFDFDSVVKLFSAKHDLN